MINGEWSIKCPKIHVNMPLGNILLFNKIMLTLNVKIAEFYAE